MLIADAFELSGRDALAAAGCDVVFRPEVKEESLTMALRSERPDALVVRSTRVTEEMLDAAALKLVVRAGAGYNTIDVAAASRRGIYVSNCPGQNSIAVAELAFGLMLTLDRRIPDNVASLREARWCKGEYSRATGVYGRTLGLVGLGSIGREMAARARAFGMNVAAWSRSLTDAAAIAQGVRRTSTLMELAATCDIVSVHLALTPDTRGLLSTEFFEAMRHGALFINTSRGEIVDENALLEAMANRGIRAGLDVYADEPNGASGEFDSKIARAPGVYGTHHIGASTEQAQEAIAAETVRIIEVFMRTGTVPNVVNLARTTPATHKLVVRHRDRPGVLAHVFDALKTADINVQETENVVFDGAQAAAAQIQVDSPLPDAVLAHIRNGNPDIIDATVLDLPPHA